MYEVICGSYDEVVEGLGVNRIAPMAPSPQNNVDCCHGGFEIHLLSMLYARVGIFKFVFIFCPSVDTWIKF
jgi:hypothetical protein